MRGYTYLKLSNKVFLEYLHDMKDNKYFYIILTKKL
jgi:hypothetical protein